MKKCHKIVSVIGFLVVVGAAIGWLCHCKYSFKDSFVYRLYRRLFVHKADDLFVKDDSFFDDKEDITEFEIDDSVTNVKTAPKAEEKVKNEKTHRGYIKLEL